MAGITFSYASGLNDSIFGKSQAPIQMFLEKRGEAFEQNSMIKEIFTMQKSRHYGEKFSTMTAMEGFQPVGENGTVPMDNQQVGYEKMLTHMTWKDSFSISREAIEDGVAINLKKKPQGFIAGYYRTRERFGAALLGAAIKKATAAAFGGHSFDVTAADGLALFSTAHTSKLGKKTQTNQFVDAFSDDALGAVESAMQDFRGDNGEILDVAPDTIVIPNLHALKKSVFAAIGADKDPNTANNGFNYQFGRWNVIVWPYLNEFITSGTAPWILMDSRYNQDYAGAVWLDRTELDVDSHVDYGTHANVWSGFARFTAGFNDWRAFAVGGVSGGTQLISTP